MTFGLLSRPAPRVALPGTDAGEAAARTPRIGNRALSGGLALLTAVIVGLDLLTGTDLQLTPLLVTAPALVAAFGTLAQTVAAAFWVTAVAVVTRLAIGGVPWDVISSLVFTAFVGLLSIGVCALRTRHAAEVARLRSAAVALQRQILRPLPIPTDQITAHGTYTPIEEDRLVGGDIYEVVQSPYGTRVIIGDVQGKGLPAIGVGFAVLGAFREAAIREPSLTAVVDRLEDAVTRQNAFAAQTGDTERFVTALVLGFDGDGRVRAVNCGHLQPRLLHDGVAVPVPLRHTSVPLGMAELSDEGRTAERLDFPPGATLLMFTDGVTEARDADGRFYPLDNRLRRWARRSPQGVLDALEHDLEEFSGGVRRDDIAVLALRRGTSAEPAPPVPAGHGAVRAAEVSGGR
ncbi:PP2C family protein-serine/threonine phosphatase [Streptomyces sp. DT224]|uniref:PP2C family protein-serine/threonine phosphatase n=1 Tax=Streptomyces sp. DT224 TaxID=3393426 RepID=UPI003CEEF7F8